MRKARLWRAAVTAGAMLISGAAVAGTPVTGTGSTPAAAMDDANRRASDISARKWGKSGCYSRAVFERCSQQQGFWVCQAFVNNEPGSSCG